MTDSSVAGPAILETSDIADSTGGLADVPAAGQDAGALIAEGLEAHKAGDLSLAETKYRAALSLEPAEPEGLLMLGVIACQMGQFDAAITLMGHAIANHPDHPAVPARYHVNLANALHGAARLDDAVVALHRALSVDPNSVEGHFNLANVLADLQRPEEAEVEYRFAIELDGHYGRAHAGLGLTLDRLGRRNEALAALRRAVALDPSLTQARVRLGCLLCEEGRFEEAESLLHGAQETEARLALGDCHAAKRDWEAARDLFAGLVSEAPRDSRVHAGLGGALYRLGDSETALSHLVRATELDLGAAAPLALCGLIALEQGDLTLAVSRLEKALEKAPDDHGAHAALIHAKSLQRAVPDPESRAEGVCWSARHGGGAPMAAPSATRLDPNRVLRVGFVTGERPGDTALQALLSVFGYRRPAAIQTHCYADLGDAEPLGDALKSLADRWTDARPMSDGDLCSAIHGDQIDILVDLSGCKPGNRLRALSRRPAPVQAAWIGQTDPLGFPFIDYVLDGGGGPEPAGAKAESPEGAERPLPVSRGLLAFVPPEGLPEPGPLPMLEAKAPGFVSMGHLAQFTEETVALFSRVLTAIGDARLRLVVLQPIHRETARRLRRRFADYGVSDRRIELVSLADGAEGESPSLAAIFEGADLALDPFPASNGFESFLALLSGLPVVSLAGPLAGSRLTAGLLAAAGLSSLQADSVVDFVSRVELLARNPEKLAGLRAEIPAMTVRSPMVDGAGMTMAFEEALREAWRRHCVLKAPASRTQH